MPRASSAARSLAVSGCEWEKKTTSSDHWRSSCAWSTEPGSVPSTPIGWSRTSQPWQYGQWRKSRPQRSRAPGMSGSSSTAPVASSSRRAVTEPPPASREREARLDLDDLVVDDLDAVAADLVSRRREEVGGWHPVAGEEALHVRGGSVPRRSGVDDDDAAPGAAEHERGAQAGRTAADDGDVIGLLYPCARRVPERLGDRQGSLLFPGTASSVASVARLARRSRTCWPRSAPA